MEKITQLISQTKREVDKVIFPTKPQIREAFLNVFLMVAIVSIFLSLIDGAAAITLSKIL